MDRICGKCGKTVENRDAVFCPYCGDKLPADRRNNETAGSREAEEWILKALAASGIPARKKILQEGLAACPDSAEIEWELLFIGEEGPKSRKYIDFSMIQSWALEIYREPEAFSEERKDALRARFFEDPRLVRYLERAEDPAGKQQEYLRRLCAEYVELFLEGNNRIMGNVLGFRLERNREKRLAVPVAEMIVRVRADEKLSPEQREQLWKALYGAYGARTGGKMEYLDEYLPRNE